MLPLGDWRPGASRRVYYLSLEYLMGRLMLNNLINTGLYRFADLALAEFGKTWLSSLRRNRTWELGQRRLGAPGGLLPRFLGHSRSSRHGLWDFL